MKKICFLLAILLTLSVMPLFTATAETTLSEGTVIADPADKGYLSYRIPGIYVTASGAVLVAWEARHDAGTDTGDTDLMLYRSANGTDFEQVLFLDQGTKSINNPVMVQDAEGTIHLLYAVNAGQGGVFHRKSQNDGVTWSEAVEITASLQKATLGWGMCNLGPGHGLCLQNGDYKGRLILPIWCYITATKSYDVYTVYSDDNGESWHMGERASNNLNETSIVELSNGMVMLNSRQYGLPYNEAEPNRTEEEAYRAVTVSKTGIDGWSETRFDETLIDPACEGSITSTKINGKHALLFVNCASKTKRRDLTVRCSFDNGHSWVEKTPYLSYVGWYSDIAVAPDGTVYVIHEGEGLTMELFTFDAEAEFGDYSNEVAEGFYNQGFQTKREEDFRIRFVSEVMYDAEELLSGGFEVKITTQDRAKDNVDLACSALYTSLLADGLTVTPTDGQYFLAAGIRGIPTEGAVTFAYRPYVTYLTGEGFYGEWMEVSFVDGVRSDLSLGKGDCSYFDWSESMTPAT